MADSTIRSLATMVAKCNVVGVDENGVMILANFPQTTGGITLGGGGYFPGQGIVIGEDNGTTQGDDVIIGSNITTTDAGYEGGNIAIGNKAEVAKGSIAIGSYFLNGTNEYTARATSYNSVAIGTGATASGTFSTALGAGTCASGEGSAALGSGTCASGLYSTAVGAGASASVDYSTALGNCACASGRQSTALGACAGASERYSTALGDVASASGEGSTALGTGASASGYNSTALGRRACASGSYSTALGSSACATGIYSTALGRCACASGESSIALGDSASASGCFSTALGRCAYAKGYGALAMGYEAEAAENEIVLRSGNEAGTACNVLKVSSAGVLTLNGKEVSGLDISKGIVIGEGATATCTITSETFVDNVAIGTGAIANQNGAIAIGCSIASGNGSVSIGHCAKASMTSSTALGHHTCADGDYSTALGYCASTSCNSSTALGANASASGAFSTALGHCATADGCGALAIGDGAQAAENEIVLKSSSYLTCACNVLKVSSAGVLTLNGEEVGGGLDVSEGIVIGEDACAGGCSYNIAIGTGASAPSGFSTALGAYASASGYLSTALGDNTGASAHSSTAVGYGAVASGEHSTALGREACARGYGALAMGYCAQATENEIVLRSRNSANTACNVLKVSSAGVLTLNGEEVGNTCVYGEIATKFSGVEEITTANNAYSLSDIATKLNEILKLLKNETTA